MRLTQPWNIDRRSLLVGTAALAAAASTTLSRSARAEEAENAPEAELAERAASCVQSGEVCIGHCLQMFAAGDTSLAACARSVHEMMAVCTAIGTLSGLRSARVKSLAAVCKEACLDCAKECQKHAEMHDECKACGESCDEMVRALEKLA